MERSPVRLVLVAEGVIAIALLAAIGLQFVSITNRTARIANAQSEILEALRPLRSLDTSTALVESIGGTTESVAAQTFDVAQTSHRIDDGVTRLAKSTSGVADDVSDLRRRADPLLNLARRVGRARR